MGFVTYLPFVRLGVRWMKLTARCVNAKKASGETIDFWERVECALSTIDDLRPDLKAALAKLKKDKDYLVDNKQKVGGINW